MIKKFLILTLFVSFLSEVGNTALDPHPMVSKNFEYEKQKKIAFSKKYSLQERWQAIMNLVDLNSEKATLDLNKLSYEKEWYLKNGAMVALNKNKPNEAKKLAQRLLKDKALVVRSMAVEILKEHLTPEIRSLLWSEMDRNYNFRGRQGLWIRQQILTTLAGSSQPQEKTLFIKYSKDKDPSIQKIAQSVAPGVF